MRYFLITFSNICMMIPLNQHLSQDFFTDFLHCTFPWTDITRKKFRLDLSAQELNYLDQRSFRFLLNVENCLLLLIKDISKTHWRLIKESSKSHRRVIEDSSKTQRLTWRLNYLDQRSFRFLLNVENCSVLPKQRRFQ